MTIGSLSRRRLAAILASLPVSAAMVAPGWARPLDQGIGGTGAAADPDEPNPDRGIGGTGVTGTIQAFGSIIVNGLRIAYPQAVAVSIDGTPTTVSALKIGHVVRVATVSRRGGLSTNAIAVTSEVIGPVEAETDDGLIVMGQAVLLSQGTGSWPVGDIVAVSGLRRSDGTIVASLVERRPATRARIAGLVRIADDGTPTIGALRLSPVDRTFAGQRCVVDGRYGPEGLSVETIRTEQSLLTASRPRNLLIEAFVALADGSVSLGSGLDVGGTETRGAAAPDQEMRAVVAIAVGADGSLALRGIRPEGGQGHGSVRGRPGPSRPSPRSSGPGGVGPGGRGGPGHR